MKKNNKNVRMMVVLILSIMLLFISMGLANAAQKPVIEEIKFNESKLKTF